MILKKFQEIYLESLRKIEKNTIFPANLLIMVFLLKLSQSLEAYLFKLSLLFFYVSVKAKIRFNVVRNYQKGVLAAGFLNTVIWYTISNITNPSWTSSPCLYTISIEEKVFFSPLASFLLVARYTAS